MNKHEFLSVIILLEGDVVVYICFGLCQTGSQVCSLRDPSVKQFSCLEVYMWVQTQSVCVEQEQELIWDLKKEHEGILTFTSTENFSKYQILFFLALAGVVIP